MEFNKKLQELRKSKGLTQEELARAIFVSRAAVSKWESGRGYPSIESLKQIAEYFSVTVDELLSADEELLLAEEDTKVKKKQSRDLIFGLLDVFLSMLFFLPFFKQSNGMKIEAVPLLLLTEVQPYFMAACCVALAATVICGISVLLFKSSCTDGWEKNKYGLSLALSIALIMLFIVGLQPYAAAISFVFLVIKALFLK